MNNNEFIALLKQISDDVCLVVKDFDSTQKELKPLIKEVVEETIKKFNGENTSPKD